MKRYISVLMTLSMVFLMSSGAQARVLKDSAPPATRGDISKGIVINGKKVPFYWYGPLDGKVVISMPQLYDLSEETKDQMYPYEQQPQFLSCTKDDANTHIAITYYEQISMDGKKLEDFMNNQKKKLAKLDPAAVFYDTRTEKLATTVSWFDYQGHNSAGKTYGLYAFFVLDGKLAVLSFDCPFKNRGEWETVAQSALPTLRVIPIGERELLAA